MKHEEEQLYICDHAWDCPIDGCTLKKGYPGDKISKDWVCVRRGFLKCYRIILYIPPDDIGPYKPKDNYSTDLLGDEEEDEKIACPNCMHRPRPGCYDVVGACRGFSEWSPIV